MKIILSTENFLSAMRLRDKIIKSLKGEIKGVSIDTWSYTKSSDNFDIIFHNPIQYIKEPNKNVLFKLEIDGSNILLSSAWWTKNPEPSYEMVCLHTGRLTEMLLRYFRNEYIKFTIID